MLFCCQTLEFRGKNKLPLKPFKASCDFSSSLPTVVILLRWR